jgi:quinoprotein dehydrogenase-associated probable ABC transporter substrate-binding protein
VCADPNNLPFSNERGEGFENRLAALLAEELGARLQYTWWPQRRGFVRNTLRAGRCDVIVGVPAGYGLVLTTRAYYRSTYVFVARADAPVAVRSLDDPVLRTLRIGVHLIGDNYMNPPPAHALARRGITGNVVAFTVYGDYATPNPPARILDAVIRREIDVAIVWGPLAGYFAREHAPLQVRPLVPMADSDGLPFTFSIAMGVREGENALRDELQAALDRRATDVTRLLDAYGVPRIADPSP